MPVIGQSDAAIASTPGTMRHMLMIERDDHDREKSQLAYRRVENGIGGVSEDSV